MMKTSPGPIYHKTARAHEELATHSHALSPRLRQLLILIDGQRSEEQLVRLIPRAEFDEYLPALESGGFIVRQDSDSGLSAPMIAPARTIIGAEPAAAAPQDENAEMRQRLVAALRAVIGEQGYELAERIERCASRRELRDLVPAALSIVEIVGGRKALEKFQEQAGLRSS